VSPDDRAMSKVIQESNWLPALEGGIDTVHSNFLHAGRPPGFRYDDNDPRGRANNVSKAPRLEVVPTDYGYMYAGIRDMGAEGTNHVRGYHWIMPWNQIRGYTRPGNYTNAGHMWVPIDDYMTMVYNWDIVFEETPGEDSRGRRRTEDPDGDPSDKPIWFRDSRRPVGLGNDFGTDVDPETFRSLRNRTNKYGIDREVQRTQTYTGIPGTNTQDRAVQESMGHLADRTLERLGTTDRAIIATRRYLMQAVKTVQEGGDPPGVAPTYYNLRAYETVVAKEQHWFDVMKSHLLMLEEPLTPVL
jgi:phthalate 4,5-dioxygenase